MGNKKGLIWYLTLFDSEKKENVFKVIACNSVKEMSYYLDMESQIVSNFYHKQIKPRGVLKYCNITQNLNL
tara:strand:+ start:10847 stop:11059 length:213 start_codon:yes stop_codon:yes gene_type:complete